MGVSKKLFSLVIFALALSGCGKDQTETVPEWASIEFEFDVPQNDRRRVVEAFNLPRGFNLDSSRNPHQELYSKAFGTEPEGVSRYIDERVNYFASLLAEDDPNVIAANPSSVLWFLQLRGELGPVEFNGRQVSVDSSRFGLVLLGQRFHTEDSRVFRLTTMIHEARHSDCPGGVDSDDLALIRRVAKDEVPSIGRFMKNDSCGFPHKICPSTADPSLAGFPACEDQLWGPYAIEALYSAVLSQSCTNCSARDLEHARLLAIDAASRVEGFTQMFSQSPDMSSQGLR